MLIQLPAELEGKIQAQIAAGRFENAAAVIAQGVALLEMANEGEDAEMVELRAALQVGLDDLAAGDVIDADEAFQELDRMINSSASDRLA